MEEKEIGKRIKDRRKELNFTTTDIKNQVGISVGNLSEIENGHKIPSSKTIIKLSEILDCSIDYLLTGKENGEKSDNDIRVKELISYYYAMSEDNKKRLINLAKKDDTRTYQLLSYFNSVDEDDKEELLILAEIKARKKGAMLSDSEDGENVGIA